MGSFIEEDRVRFRGNDRHGRYKAGDMGTILESNHDDPICSVMVDGDDTQGGQRIDSKYLEFVPRSEPGGVHLTKRPHARKAFSRFT